MKLAKDWKTSVKRYWSFRLAILAAILSGAEVYVQFAASSLSVVLGGKFAIAAAGVSLLAALARLVAQKK